MLIRDAWGAADPEKEHEVLFAIQLPKISGGVRGALRDLLRCNVDFAHGIHMHFTYADYTAEPAIAYHGALPRKCNSKLSWAHNKQASSDSRLIDDVALVSLGGERYARH